MTGGGGPEDFRVEEIPLFAPAGRGAHTYVQVEKRLCTTEEVARLLARRAGVPPREVGYAGRKDRVALARQWFSVPGLDPESLPAELAPGVRILAAARHPHKLRVGQLRGNRFRLLLRGVAAGALAEARARLEVLRCRGLPNRFGPQRYGRDGENPARGLRVLRGELGLRDRRQARFLVSALQAAVFDEVLRRRPLALDDVEAGEVVRLEASGGCFVVEDEEAERARARRFELSPTGPIFGSRTLEPRGPALLREREALARLGVPPELARRPPRGLRLRGGRRPLRVRVGDPALRLLPGAAGEPGAVELSFELPPGSFASVLLEELLPGARLPGAPPAREAARAGEGAGASPGGTAPGPGE